MSARLLTLTGVGGVGKSRLGLRVAAEAQRGFADGAWLVEFAAVEDEELLASAVAATLGAVNRSVRPPVDALLEHLADARLLLVLDNCEHLLDACAVLVGKLLGGAPGLRVLATSRQPLGIDGEHVLGVAPLSVPEVNRPLPAGGLGEYEAVQLFTERAAAAAPGFAVTDANRQVVVRLCQRLDGVPLAIELAAVRLRALSVEQVLERLDDRFRLLTGGSRVALSRQRTLRATIDWSSALCSPGERVLWARASVFSGGFDLRAAEAVCGGDGIATADVLELVAGLVDKSVLLREEHEPWARYRLLETVRQYGRERLVESGQETVVRARHRDWYQRLVEPSATERFGPDHVRWLVRVDRDWANVRAALDFCVSEPGQAGAGMRIAAGLRDYWMVNGTPEGYHWFGRALALAPEEPSAARFEALWVYVWLALGWGDTATVPRRLHECRALARQLRDPVVFARVVDLSGVVAMYQGNIRRAYRLLERALTSYRALRDAQARWGCLLHLAVISFVTDRTAPYAEECLALAEAHGSEWHRSWAQWIAGVECLRRGEPGRATLLLRESLRFDQSLRMPIEEPWRIAHCLEGLAWTAAAEGKHDRAARLFGAAHPIWRSTGTLPTNALTLGVPHDRYETQVRDALGDRAFTAAFQRGATLTADRAIAYALENKPAARLRLAAPEAAAVLTRRECQVAELVAQGLSNKDIAAKLVIAQRTAETHVERILTKLGFTSRTQVAVWHLSVKPDGGS